jgi:hypothetical protein
MERVLTVGEPIMAAGEPRVFVDNATQPIAKPMIGALPQRPKRPSG